MEGNSTRRTGARPIPLVLLLAVSLLAIAVLFGLALAPTVDAQEATPAGKGGKIVATQDGGLVVAATSWDRSGVGTLSVAEDCTAGEGVCVYENPYYGGRWARFVGTGCFADFNQIGFNDLASSIRFSGSYAGGWYNAVLYEHTYYGGVYSQFSFDDPDLGNDAIGNDRASSVCVNPSQPVPQCTGDGVYLYQDINYGGACRSFTGNVDDLTWTGFNDVVSSIRLVGSYGGGRYRATLCEHAGYTGACSTFTSDDPDLRDNTVGNDRASSLLIEQNTATCPSIADWKGEYWNNKGLSGSPVLCRNDVAVNFDWGDGGPGGGVPNDNFSARWTRDLYFAAGRYRFHLSGDDGIRLWVDGNLIIDQWHDQARTEYTADRDLTAGNHNLRVEYYENLGGANVALWWDQVTSSCPTITDWKGEYWNNKGLAGSPVLCRNDTAVNFNWGAGGPGGGVPNDNFSARWTRDLHFAAGRYRFHLSGDDGIRLWVDGNLIVDQWHDQARTEYTADRDLTAGNHNLRVEYYENLGDANVALWWDQSTTTCPAYRAEYYNNQSLQGNPAYVVCENAPINHAWGGGGPGYGIGSDNFSARWTGRFHFNAGTYTFIARTDDGMRVWIGGNLVIDAWRIQATTEYRYATTLNAGDYDVRVEYYENNGEAVAQFWWEQGSSASGVVISNKPAFDACRLPLVNEMQLWWAYSPYYEANIYLGGINRGCNDWNQQTLTSGWVQAVHSQGWNFIPTWVGLQAPCNTNAALARMSWDANTAYNQGRAEADAAVNAARSVGLTSLGSGRTAIYYTVAPYPNDAACRNSVKSFISGWTGRLHEWGMRAGAYGASCASYVTDWASIANIPDDIWPATANWPRYDPYVTVWNVGSCVPNTLWTNHQRIFQYTPGHAEAWGNLSLTIDSNIADGAVAGTNSRSAQAAGQAAAARTGTASGPDLLAARLVTGDQGWVLTRDRLSWSSDGGEHFAEITPSGIGSASLRGAEFVDPLHGWLVYSPEGNGGGSPALVVARTVDGGRTWSTAPLGAIPGGESGFGAVSLSFVDPSTGWLSVQLASSSNFSLAALYTTRDGGTSWSPQSVPIAGPIRFINQSTGWVAGGSAGDEMYVTRDGGVTWGSQPDLPRTSPGAAQFLYGLPSFQNDRDGVMAVTIADSARPRVELYRTANGGASWQPDSNIPLERAPATAVETAIAADGAWLAVDAGGGQMRVAVPGNESLKLRPGPGNSSAAWTIKRYGTCQGDKTGATTGQPFVCEQHAGLVRTRDGGATWEDLQP